MTATYTSFVATGWPGRIGPGSPAANVGFYASAQPLGRATHPFQFGAFAVGYQAGIYGATDDVGPPANTTWDEAAVVGTSNNKHGVFGISSTRYGVMGQRGVKTTHAIPPPAAGVMGLSQDAHGVVGVSDSGNGVKGESYQAAGVSAYSFSSVGVDAVTEVGPAGIFGRAVGSGNGVTGIAATNAGVFGVTEPAGPFPI